MSVGLPGTGVGALFYLLSALWAPVNAVLRRTTGRSRGVAVSMIALGIVAIVAVSTVAIGALVPAATVHIMDLDAGVGDGSARAAITPLVAILLLGPVGTLAFILLVVRIGAWIGARGSARDATPASDTSVASRSDTLDEEFSDPLSEQLTVAS
jgi:hypothetical protein